MAEIDVVCEKLARIEGTVNAIHQAVYGNGNVGLKEQAALNTEFRVRTQKMLDGLFLKLAGVIVLFGGIIIALGKMLL